MDIFREVFEIPGGSFYLLKGNEYVLSGSIEKKRFLPQVLDISVEETVSWTVINEKTSLLIEDITETDFYCSGYTDYAFPTCGAFCLKNRNDEVTGLCFLHGFKPDANNFELLKIIWSFISEIFKLVEMTQQITDGETKFKTLVESTPYGIFLHQNGNLIFANKSLYRILGYNSEDISAFSHKNRVSVFDFVHSGDREFVKSYAMARALGEDVPKHYNMRLVHKNGHDVNVEVSINIVMIDNQVAIMGVITDLSDRIKDELDRLERENRYQVLFENAGDAIFTLFNGTVTEVNSAGCDLFQMKREEIIGRNYADFSRGDRDYIEKKVNDYRRQVKEEGKACFEWEFVSPNQSEKLYCEVTLSAFSQNSRTYFLAVLRNITQRKIKDEELKFSEYRYRTIFENASIGIFKSRGSRFIDVNYALAKLAGFNSREEMVSSISDIATDFYVDPFHRDVVIQEIIKSDGKIFDFQTEFKKSDGTSFIASVSANAVFDRYHKIDFIEGFVRDITARVQMEKFLKESERKYRDLVEYSPVGILSIDIEGKIISVNNSIIEILGSPSKEATMSLNILEFPPLIKSGISAKFRQCFDTGELVFSETPYVSKWGKILNLRYTISPLFDQTNTIYGAQVIVEDNTLMLETENERKRLEAQLFQSQKMEAIGRLAGGIAHDFNNIITTITGNASLVLMDTPENDPLVENLKEIVETSERAGRLTRQLLSFSKKQIIQPQLLDLNYLIDNFKNMISRIIGEDIELQTNFDSELRPVMADPSQIEQIIINLVVNAREAMPQGGMLAIETSNHYLDEYYIQYNPGVNMGDYVCLTVRDTGEGMDSEVQKKIFEPFFSTKSPEQSSGLGLATTYGIVKQHGGHIHVQSEPMMGTSFKIFFPSHFGKPEYKVGASRLDFMPHGRETILLVEDDKSIINVVSKLLKRLGYNLITASNGGEALIRYEMHNGNVDLLLTDIVMPEMSGIELAERIRQKNSEIRILFSSGYSESFLENRDRIPENHNFIAKPYNIGELATAIKRILNKDE